MLFKKLSLSFLAVCLATAPLLAVSAPNVVAQGQFEDGAMVAWQCADDMKGTMKVLFVHPSGKKYMMDLSCGESI